MQTKEHYSVKWLKKYDIRAITIGHHIFYAVSKFEIPSWLRNHEEVHVEQYERYGVFLFLFFYALDYVMNRLKGMSPEDAYYYTPFEVEARKGEYGNGH